MPLNTRFFNKIFYIQRYYDIYIEKYIWRFWILGLYFETKLLNQLETKTAEVNIMDTNNGIGYTH